MDNIFQVFAMGDFDMSYTVALCTNIDKAEKMIKKHANRFRKVTIVNVGIDKFKVKEWFNGETYDYWVKEVKLNTLL